MWTGYFSMRLVARRTIEDETNDLAGSVIFRVAALHGLILALVFAQELFSYQQLRNALVREATAVADIYYDFERYGAENAQEIQTAIVSYVQEVQGEEWRLLSEERRLSSSAWAKREIVYSAILDLNPASAREIALRDHMLEKVRQVAEMRQERENSALNPLNRLFWVPAIVGLFLVAMPYFVFSPTLLNVTLLSVYGGFSGLVLFVIFAFSDPFSPPNKLEPVAFERLLENLRKSD